ncbi:hypothetical protein K438DRAFT_1779548 [Mycena galopus ATCC 62051]|nr:hypothetical protein K438DRAFT_1779548 [Mycena galopus ATCC 62051]
MLHDILAQYAAPSKFFVPVRAALGRGAKIMRCWLLETQSRTAEVGRMMAAHKHRRRGIAKRLMRAIVEHAGSVQGLHFVELETNGFQLAARRLRRPVERRFGQGSLLWAAVWTLDGIWIHCPMSTEMGRTHRMGKRVTPRATEASPYSSTLRSKPEPRI